MKPFAIIYIFLFIPVFLEAGVSSNPFLRPGSSKQPPPPPKSVPPPPVKITNAEKEVEFRGYFILNGNPFFCIFNKKSGHAEWLAVSESTFESYLIKEFDLENEKLTLSFDGQSFSLFLMDSKSGGTQGSPSKVTKTENSNNPTSLNPSKQVTRFMPPRPKSTPNLPDWLSRKKTSVRTPTSPSFSGTYPGAIPRRIDPVPFIRSLPNSGQSQNASGSVSAGSPQVSTSDSSSPVSSPSVQSAPSINGNTAESAPAGNALNESAIMNESDDRILLENLPPPPPPPNIVPPSPPPDIQPSRDE
jgi:hypothetical protein